MTEEVKVEEPKMDYKEFSRLLLFEGVVNASKYAATFSETSLDDMAIVGIEKLGELFLTKKEE